MSDCQKHLDRLVGQINARTGVETQRGPDGQYLYGASDRDDIAVGVSPGLDHGFFFAQSVVGSLPEGKEGGTLQGLLAANTALAGIGYPAFAFNSDQGAVLAMMSFHRLDDLGNERDADWLERAITAFLNAAVAMKELLETGTARMGLDRQSGTGGPDGLDDGDPPEIMIKV